MKKSIFFVLLVIFVFSCKKDEPTETKDFATDLNSIKNRNFLMGFTSWPFGSRLEDINETYQFIQSHGDIYSQQIDNKIPWKAWINNTSLPTEFVNDINFRVSKKTSRCQLLLSVSLLNRSRNDLLEDYDGSIPDYNFLYDTKIEDAYFKHLTYLIDRFQPNYLVMAMESNELLKNTTNKWAEYKILMLHLRGRLKVQYPTLKLSESVTLHNWYNIDVANPSNYIEEISNYVNQLDFAAISFYPYFKGLHTKPEFQSAFDFLHAHVKKSIAIVETGHLAENLDVESYNVSIKSDTIEQNNYLETLLLNAYNKDYEFIIWWTHRDYDALWQTFPDEAKDLGKFWKDTGLKDENGKERPALTTWKYVFDK